MANRVEIYALKHPVSGEIRYIGKANNTPKRLASHIRDSRRRDTPVYRWIRKLANQGLCPVAEVIEVCHGDWKETETRHISGYRGRGYRLLNVAVGGDEPYCPLGVRQENGRKTARAVHDNPISKKLWTFKKMVGDDLRFFKKRGMDDTYNRIVVRCQDFATKYPELFSSWASLEKI